MENSSRDLTLPEVANVANMAVTTFSNFFKEKYKTTFVEYLNSVRIGNACKLLSEKYLNIIEISYECGFNNLQILTGNSKKT